MNWSDWILGNELPIRLRFFFGIFAVMILNDPERSLSDGDQL